MILPTLISALYVGKPHSYHLWQARPRTCHDAASKVSFSEWVNHSNLCGGAWKSPEKIPHTLVVGESRITSRAYDVIRNANL